MSSAVVTKCPWTTGFLITVTTAQGRVIGNSRAGQTAEEAAAVLASAMLRHHIFKQFVLGPTDVMEHIHRICPGRRIR